MATRRKKNEKTDLGIKGFFRVQVVERETGKVVGDSGEVPNQITNYGMYNCFLGAAGKCTGSVQIQGCMLGNGTVPASSATALNTPNSDYYAAVGTVINNSTQLQFTQSFDGATGAATIANIGLFASTGYNSDCTLIAGNTFSSSAVATSQDVNTTYNINYTRS